MTKPEEAAAGPPTWAKWLVSLVVLAHFGAIFVNVTSAGSPLWPGPQISMEVGRDHVQPYVTFLLINNAYRFYAPDPGPTDLIWFRLRYKDGSVKWVQTPNPEIFRTRWFYQRELALALSLRQHMGPSENTPNSQTLNRGGKACVESFARYMARTRDRSRTNPDGTIHENPVTEVRVYYLYHQILLPWEIQMGIEHTDIRLYWPILYLGAYDAKGELTDQPTNDMPIPPLEFAATVIKQDVLPLKGGDIQSLSLPEPIQDFLVRFPQFRNGVGGSELVRNALMSQDRPRDVRDHQRRQAMMAEYGPTQTADERWKEFFRDRMNRPRNTP